jgi:hypothetical protein
MGEKTLSVKLSKHFAALGAAAAAVTGVAGVAQQSDAAIVYSGVQNINVPATFAGVYLNMVTGATSTTGAFLGFDINPWSNGGALNFFTSSSATTGSGPAGTRGFVAATPTGAALNLAPLTPIGPASIYNEGTGAGTAFTGTTGLLGVRIRNENMGNAVQFGWLRIAQPGTTGGLATIVDWAYETDGSAIPAGAVPEPASLGLLAMGALGLAARRKR